MGTIKLVGIADALFKEIWLVEDVVLITVNTLNAFGRPV